jgi:hypothetical protein
VRQRKPRNPEVIFLTPERRLAASMRVLQKLMRDKIDPEGSMTDAEFVNAALGIIDNDDTNAAMDQIEGD